MSTNWPTAAAPPSWAPGAPHPPDDTTDKDRAVKAMEAAEAEAACLAQMAEWLDAEVLAHELGDRLTITPEIAVAWLRQVADRLEAMG